MINDSVVHCAHIDFLLIALIASQPVLLPVNDAFDDVDGEREDDG